MLGSIGRRSGALVLLGLFAPGLVEDAAAQTVGCLWDRLTDAPIGRFEAGTLAIDDLLYSFGGFFTQAIQATARSDRYDPATDLWTRIADLPTPVTHAPYVQIGREVWLLGGFVGDNPGVATADVWIYEVDQDTWRAGPALPSPIAGGAACLLGQELHYFGGCEADRVTVTGAHWALDLGQTSPSWQARADMPRPRCHLSGAVLGGDIWAIGGQIGHDVSPLDTRFVDFYQAVTDRWFTGPALPHARSHFEGATFVENGFLYIAGGKNQTIGRDTLSGVLELDPVLRIWSYLPQLPLARHGIGARKIGDHLYLTGGSGPSNFPARDVYRREWSAEFPSPLRINCGGEEVAAVSGGCWCGDFGAENGSTVAYNPNADVLGTEEDAAYDRQRRSSGSAARQVAYRLPMGDGFYRVRVFLAERTSSAPGHRVMDLQIEDKRVIEDLDVAATAGYQTALERGFDAEVTDDVLNLYLLADPGQRAVVAALEIERLDPGHFASVCQSLPNSTGQSAELDFVGSTSLAQDHLTLVAQNVPQDTFGLFIQSRTADSVALPGGLLCVGQPFYRLPVEQAQGATLTHRLEILDPPVSQQQITAGSTWYFQGWFRDGAAAGYGLTGALRLRFTP